MNSFRKPNKLRIFDAINHTETNEVPILEIDPDMSLVNQILGKELPMHLHPFEMEADDNVELNLRMGNDLTFFGHVWRVGRKQFSDSEGRLHYADGEIKNRTQMKDIWFPDLAKLEKRLEEHCKTVQGTGMGIMAKAQTAAFTTMCAMGYNDFLLNTVMDADFVMDFIKRIHEYCMKELEVFLKYPVDMVQFSSGLVTNSAPMVSYDELEKLEFHFIEEGMQLARSKGKKINFHIDGKIDNLIPRFLEMGVDILNPIDLCAGNQYIFEIKETYGDKITISGNIDIEGVLRTGTAAEVYENVKMHIDKMKKGGGYIVSSSHNLHEHVPIENFFAMRDAVLEYN
jgi:hypothetical protein